MTVEPLQQIAIEERRHQVMMLKKIGMSDRAIQAHLNAQGIKISHMTVNKDWHKVLKDWKETRTADTDEMQELQHARLESMIHAHWAKATGWKLGEPGINNDPDPRSAAIILRAIEDIRELYGLDNAVGTAENPLTLNLPPEPPTPAIPLDLEGMSHDELERFHDIFGAVIEAQRIALGDA